MADRGDVWASGDAYEPYVGRWSRLVSCEFVDWLALPQDSRWLDVGCGTGALSQIILERCSPSQVVGVDPSQDYLDYARGHVIDARMSFRAGSAEALPVQDAEFDAAVAGLVLNFMTDTQRAVAEMRRAVRPGGAVAGYVWD